MYVLRIHYRKHNISSTEFGAWIGIWSGFLFFTFFPSTLSGLAETLYISRVFDLVILIALTILCVFVIFTRLEMKALHQKLEKFSRDSAHESVEKHK